MNYESSQRPRGYTQTNGRSHAPGETRRAPQGSAPRSPQGGAYRNPQGGAYRNPQSGAPRRAAGKPYANSYARSRRRRRTMQRRIRAIVLLILLIVLIVVIVNLARGCSRKDPIAQAAFSQTAESTQEVLALATAEPVSYTHLRAHET